MMCLPTVTTYAPVMRNINEMRVEVHCNGEETEDDSTSNAETDVTAEVQSAASLKVVPSESNTLRSAGTSDSQSQKSATADAPPKSADKSPSPFPDIHKTVASFPDTPKPLSTSFTENHKTSTFADVHKSSTFADVHKSSTFAEVHKTSTFTDVHKSSFTDVHKSSTFADVHKTSTFAEAHKPSGFADVHKTSTFAEVHKSSTIHSVNKNASPLPPLPPTSLEDEGRGSTPPLEDHDYEDIYSVRGVGRDSGSHSRSASMSSVQSESQIVVATPNNDSSESGVSSPSPSELGNKSESEENDKVKLEHRHSLPHSAVKDNKRSLKRVVSVPVGSSPPPPPPPPPSEESSLSALSSLPTSSPNSQLNCSNSTNHACQQSSNETPGSQGNGGQVGHLVNKQMVLPFIPPKFGEDHDPEALIKPSEYLKSLQGAVSAIPGKQAPILTPPTDVPPPGPPAPAPPPGPPVQGPPPPPPPPPTHQPLSTISIQDITSVQLKRTATKTMSCPHPSLNGAVEPPFQSAKENLIAELKMSRDISGIKKLKVERVEMEKKQGKEIANTISKQFTVDSFVEKMPDKDAAGNPIPAWKRQMLAKKAAEKARKEAEEELVREAELKRLQAIPAWKRHLLQKKGDGDIPFLTAAKK